ncbi:hypothetical protein [Halobaculum sp. EA56]|uniref:hypothetical protein n=1 Tax=Halobaculum sp. EA56 TaxID=3421648 RepID=UPI003EBFF99D
MDDDREEADSTEPKGLPEPTATPRNDVPRDDLPADVEAALAQLIASARESLRAGDRGEALASVDTAETVAATELPDGDRRDRLLHGCARVADLAEADPSVAAEYLDAMRRRLA